MPEDRSKTCTVNIGLSYPLGSAFAVIDTTYRGTALLDVSITASIASSYRITGDQAGDATLQTQATLPGVLVGDYTRTVAVPAGSVVSSPCGAGTSGLQFTTRLALSSSNAAASGSVLEDPPFSLSYQQLHLEWRDCKR